MIDEGKYTRSWLGIGIGDLRDDPDYRSLDGKLAPDAQEGVVVTEIMLRRPRRQIRFAARRRDYGGG